jgi:hypothetical protein
MATCAFRYNGTQTPGWEIGEPHEAGKRYILRRPQGLMDKITFD